MESKTYWEDLVIGSEEHSDEFLVDREEMLAYNRRYDPWPIHVDEEAAQKSPFGGIIASGGYTISLWYQSTHLMNAKRERPLAFLGGFDWEVKFPNPVYPGDRLVACSKILDKWESSKPWRGHVESLVDILNQKQKTVISIRVKMLVQRRPAGEAVNP